MDSPRSKKLLAVSGCRRLFRRDDGVVSASSDDDLLDNSEEVICAPSSDDDEYIFDSKNVERDYANGLCDKEIATKYGCTLWLARKKRLAIVNEDGPTGSCLPVRTNSCLWRIFDSLTLLCRRHELVGLGAHSLWMLDRSRTAMLKYEASPPVKMVSFDYRNRAYCFVHMEVPPFEMCLTPENRDRYIWVMCALC
jgi:hypothetical protein